MKFILTFLLSFQMVFLVPNGALFASTEKIERASIHTIKAMEHFKLFRGNFDCNQWFKNNTPAPERCIRERSSSFYRRLYYDITRFKSITPSFLTALDSIKDAATIYQKKIEELVLKYNTNEENREVLREILQNYFKNVLVTIRDIEVLLNRHNLNYFSIDDYFIALPENIYDKEDHFIVSYKDIISENDRYEDHFEIELKLVGEVWTMSFSENRMREIRDDLILKPSEGQLKKIEDKFIELNSPDEKILNKGKILISGMSSFKQKSNGRFECQFALVQKLKNKQDCSGRDRGVYGEIERLRNSKLLYPDEVKEILELRQDIFNYSHIYKEKIDQFLDESLSREINKASEMVIARVIFSYIQNILLPVRDLIQLKNLEEPADFNLSDIMVDLPSFMISDELRKSGALEQKMNWDKNNEPLYLDLEDNGDFWSISFNEKKMKKYRDNILTPIGQGSEYLLKKLNDFKLKLRGEFKCKTTKNIEGINFPVCKDSDLGFYGDLQKAISRQEVEEVSHLDLSILGESLIAYFNEAKNIKSEIQNNMKRSTDLSNKEILLSYIVNVLVSIRDLIVLTKPYLDLDLKIDDLYLNIPSSIFPEESEDYIDLKVGRYVGSDPYRIDLALQDNGFYKISFNEEVMMNQRDLSNILKFPSGNNYLYAVRLLSVHTMMSQQNYYDQIAGKKKTEYQVPNSCVNNKANGHWQKSMTFDRKLQIDYDKVLGNMNLGRSSDAYSVARELINGDEVNPFRSNLYSAYDSVRVQNGLQYTDRNGVSKYKRPMLDDYLDYDLFMESKKGITQSIFHEEIQSKSTAWYYTSFEEIIGEYTKTDSVMIAGEEVFPYFENYSPFIVRELQQKGILDVERLISNSLRSKLRKTEVITTMPSLYSSRHRREWAFKKIIEMSTLVESKLGNHPLVMKKIKDVHTLQSNFRENNYFKSLDQIKKEELESSYKKLFEIWNYFISLDRIHDFELGLVTNEYDYLIEQFNASNPWARVRVGYLIQKELVDRVMNTHNEAYRSQGLLKRMDAREIVSSQEFTKKISKFTKAAHYLKLNKVQRPWFMYHELSSKDQLEIWGKVKDKRFEEGEFLYNVEVSGKRLYQWFGEISFINALELSNLNHKIAPDLLNGIRSELKSYYTSEKAREIKAFLEIAKGKTLEEKVQIYNSYNEEKKLEYQDMYLEIVDFDMGVKEILYKELVKRAARIQSIKIKNQLSAFCDINIEDEEEIREVFYSTTKIQDKINGQLGLPQIPKEISSKLTESGWVLLKEVGLGLGGFLLAIAATTALAACVGLTAGLCGPVAMLVIGAGVGMQFTLWKIERGRNKEAASLEARIRETSDLGLSSHAKIADVKRKWGWLMETVEFISILPFFGLVTRGGIAGTRAIKVGIGSITTNYRRGTKSWSAFKTAWMKAGQDAKTAAKSAEIDTALMVLGFNSLRQSITRLIEQTGKSDEIMNLLKLSNFSTDDIIKYEDELKTLKEQLKNKQISYLKFDSDLQKLMNRVRTKFKADPSNIYSYGAKTVDDITHTQLKAKTAYVVSRYFGDNPGELRRFLKSHINKISKRKNWARDRAGYLKAQRGEYAWGTNWYKKLRHESRYNLSKNHKAFNRIVSELGNKSKGDLEEYILKNLDELSLMLAKTPMRLVDVPYLFIQGGPHIGGLLRGRRLPGLQNIGEAIVVRKMFNAYDRISMEITRSAAKKELGEAFLKVSGLEGIDLITQADSIKAFYIASEEMAAEASNRSIESLRKVFSELTDEDQIKLMLNNKEIKEHFSEVIRTKADAGFNELQSLIKESDNLSPKEIEDLLNTLNQNELERLAKHTRGIILNPKNGIENFQSATYLKEWIYGSNILSARRSITEAGFSIIHGNDKTIKGIGFKNRVAQYAKANGIDVNHMDDFERVMFYPETPEERLLSEVLLGKLNIEKLIKSGEIEKILAKDEFKFFISQGARSYISNDENVKITQEERIISLIPVINMYTRMGVVEIF